MLTNLPGGLLQSLTLVEAINVYNLLEVVMPLRVRGPAAQAIAGFRLVQVVSDLI